MPFVTDGRTLIDRAYEGAYALPAFNVSSLAMIAACIQAADLERAPIMLQTAPGDLRHITPEVAAASTRAVAERAAVPVMLHCDHSSGPEAISRSLRAGYSSVMFDGDAYALDENVRRTGALAPFVHAAGASLEAAAGSFGGKEEGASSELHLTEPEAAARLHEAGADMVACSVGSVHAQASTLDLERLEAIHEVTRKPLVLHGGSGIPAADLAAAVKLGVVKVNVSASLARGVGRALQSGPDNHYTFYERARAEVLRVAREKIRLMNASGQA